MSPQQKPDSPPTRLPRAEDELPKTNNRIEGWHNKLQAAIGAKNPSLWTLITALQRDHSLNEVSIAQMIGGHHAEPRRKKNTFDVKIEFATYYAIMKIATPLIISEPLPTISHSRVYYLLMTFENEHGGIQYYFENIKYPSN